MIDEAKIKYTIENFKVFSSEETTKLLLEYTKLKNQITNYKDGKVVYLVVGPSGSGKSTFIANLYANNIFGNQEGNFVPFVNRFYFNSTVEENQKIYLQGEIALKRQLLEKGKCFVMESANFDENYLNFIKEIKEKYGYKICMIYLTKRHPLENIRCVEKRVEEGYHGMKTRERNLEHVKQMYITDGTNLKRAIPVCNIVFVVNNKTQNFTYTQKPVVLMQKSNDGIIKLSDLQRYQQQYDMIINPNVKYFGRYLVRKPQFFGRLKLPEHYILQDGKIINKITGKEIRTLTKK